MKVAERKNVDTSAVSFNVIKNAVAKQFELMKQHGLFRIDLSGPQGELMSAEQRVVFTGDKLWETYLAAFPVGTNPVYRERGEHDCQCCKAFVRKMGAVVAIIDGRMATIWDGEHAGFYAEVAVRMSDLVYNAPIDNIFLHTEKAVGTEKSFMQIVGDAEAFTRNGAPASAAVGVKVWEHFHLRLPDSVVLRKDAIGPRESDARATHDVLKRGLEELTLDAVDTVLELIAQNSLYRGAEYKGILQAFKALYLEAKDIACTTEQLDLFVWSKCVLGSQAVLRIRNTAIGTLLIDLSGSLCEDDGCPQQGTKHVCNPLSLEDAVKKFETSIMAPANYKRPTALVSKAMIAKAKEAVEALGLTSALERRYAHIDDITVNNILFADRANKRLSKNAFDDLAASVTETPRTYDKVEEIGIGEFVKSVLPTAKYLELMVENRHVGNLVSLVAPVDPGAKSMFKWPNNFSWSYNGDVADSIKEKVKKAGGSVVGDLCCRLAWDYSDDLDFHMMEPGASSSRLSGRHIYFGVRTSVNGGRLDVDANGQDGPRENPVENIFYADKRGMEEGVYELSVHNYNRRSSGVGFEVEIEFGGTVHNFVYDKALHTNQRVVVASILYSKKTGFITSTLSSTQSSKQVWGVHTNTFHKVNVVMLSPNHWDVDTTNSDIERSLRSGIGNKHFFFMLADCSNEGVARGFYNEFLSQELEPHRKTMEMVGAKMKTDQAERQLSGLGFSSTQRSSVLVRVTGKFARVVKVVF